MLPFFLTASGQGPGQFLLPGFQHLLQQVVLRINRIISRGGQQLVVSFLLAWPDSFHSYLNPDFPLRPLQLTSALHSLIVLR